jgi:hypothetical protein
MQFVTPGADKPTALSFVFAKYIWIHFIITILLTAVTFAIWFAYYF